MRFVVSRHAKRRLKLYNIDVRTVESIVSESTRSAGKHEVVRDVPGFTYPIKVVYIMKDDEATLVTAFPLKRRK